MRFRTLAAILFTSGLGWVPALVSAQGAPVSAVPPGPDFYSSALQAYLTGDFDQAILFDSKALQANPQDAKAQALLSLLVNEKDKANKTVIWIGQDAKSEMPLPAPVALPQPVTVIQERVVQNPVPRPAAVNHQAMAELEARVNAVAFLLERDSNSQYRELTGAQASTSKRLEEISLNLKDLKQGSQWANILFILALLVSIAALAKSWQNGREIREQMSALNQDPREKKESRVVQIRRM